MKQVRPEAASWESLYRIMLGPISARLVTTGLSLKVFDLLDDWTSVVDLAAKLDSHPANTASLLDGLTALEVLDKQSARYRLRAEAAPYLKSDSTTYLGHFFLWLQPLMRAMDFMPALVKNGPPVFPPETLSFENMYAKTSRFTPNCNRAGLAEPAVAAAAQVLEAAGVKRFLDLGGGSGDYAVTLARRLEKSQGVIFDRPGVTGHSRANIEKEGLADRLSVVSGDMLTDPLGRDYDLVWTTMSLNHVKAELDLILDKIKAALKPGGFMVSFHEGLEQEMTAPDIHALGIVPFVMAGGLTDPLFSKGELAEAMTRAGFHPVLNREIQTGLGPLYLDIGRLEEPNEP